MRLPFEHTSQYYDNAEFQVANATTDYDVATNQTSLFGGATSMGAKFSAYYLRLVTDQTITVKLNLTTNSAITITSSMSPFVLDEVVEVSNLYITNNSGSIANVKVFTAKLSEKTS